MISYWPVIKAGFFDSLHLGNLVGWLLFGIFLSLCARRRSGLLVGFFFIQSNLIGSLLIGMGAVDQWVMLPWIDRFWDVVYFLAAAFLVVLSAILLRDWSIFGKPSRRVWIPFSWLEPSSEEKHSSLSAFGVKFFFVWLFKLLLLPLAVFWGGLILALVESAWPSRLYGEVFLHQELTPKNLTAVFLFYISYLSAAGWLLWLTWGFFASVRTLKSWRGFLRQRQQKLRISFAALFLGVGICVLTYYFK